MPNEAARRSPGLADPTELQPFRTKPKTTASGVAPAGSELLQVIVETPRGSRNKYSYDEEQRTFVLKKTLPAGMCFPFDFGFLPRTLGGDGDALDVLLLLEDPCFSGCAVPARLLGVMEVEQVRADATERNDRLIAVADCAVLYSAFQGIDDLPEQLRREVSTFFATYHALQGSQHRTLAWGGPERARELIDEGRQRFEEAQTGPEAAK